ncbi:class I SAM-dependent methyltransferase [Kineococcus sp. SYSU DK003]|uniref:class I SAM-dependent methyltransferase n=1 Tax=Kineococcus sp. SYSU DK003 TaxID=3383124 RepID=UPI003D7ECDB4
MDVQERMNSYWTRRAPSYDDHQRRSGRAALDRQVWQEIWTGVLPGARDVLDVGTGSGYVAHLLAGLGHRVTGIDLAGGMLERAREHGGTAVFRAGDAVDPPFPAASFDAVVNRYVVWTLRDPVAAVRNWRKVLRPGGILAVVDGAWFPDGLHAGATEEFRHWYDESVRAELPLAEGSAGEALSDLLRTVGFTDVRTRPLTALLDLDHEHGVAPGHQPTLQFLTTARRGDHP